MRMMRRIAPAHRERQPLINTPHQIENEVGGDAGGEPDLMEVVTSISGQNVWMETLTTMAPLEIPGQLFDPFKEIPAKDIDSHLVEPQSMRRSCGR